VEAFARVQPVAIGVLDDAAEDADLAATIDGARAGVIVVVTNPVGDRARTRFHVNAQDGLTEVAQDFKALVTELETELVFALSMKAATALVAGGIFWALVYFVHENCGMDL